MSHSCYFAHERATADVRFKDFETLDTAIRSILENDSAPEDVPSIAFEEGELRILGYECESPEAFAETYGLFDLRACQLVARHLVSGRILIRLVPEGAVDEIYLIEPGRARQIDVAALLGFADE